MRILLALLLQEAPPPPPPDPSSSAWTSWVRGSLHARYRHRWTGDDDDSDLYQFLQLSAGDPLKDPVSAAFSARFAEDLDRENGPFASLDDTYDHHATARVYTAYVDVRHDALRVRAGRQFLDELPEMLPLDGLRVLAATEEVEFALFAGLPVNLFESSTDGDLAYGGWAAVRPWARARLRAEYLHLDDENLFGDFDDDLIGATLEQGWGPLLFSGRHTWLEDKGREAVAFLSGALPELGFLFDLRVRYAYERQQALSYALDPFATFMMAVEPHVDVSARVSQALGHGLAVDASVVERRFVRDGDETTYNHEFTRWSLAPRLDLEAVTLVAVADYWNSTADDFWTAGGEIAWRVEPGVVLSAGTSYALYTIDLLSGEERERVRTYSTSLRWAWTAATRFDLRFTIEENDFGTWRALDVGVRHAF
jgi:hypothetical protein